MKKGLKIGLFVVYAVAVIVTMSFVESEGNKIKCKAPVIFIESELGQEFLRKSDIENLLITNFDSIENKEITKLNVSDVEKTLNKLSPVKSSECYVTVDGKVFINIRLRKVLMRCISDDNKGFYIDSNGEKMAWLPNYTARVVVATGDFRAYGRKYYEIDSSETELIDSLVYEDLKILSRKIGEDEFWNRFTDHIYFDSMGDLRMVPKVGDYKIIFGDLSSIDVKMNSLKIFYQEGLSKVGWRKYKEIDLRNKGQIVCKKRS